MVLSHHSRRLNPPSFGWWVGKNDCDFRKTCQPATLNRGLIIKGGKMEVKGFCSTCENAHRDAIGKLCCFKYKYEGHLTPENGYCHDYKPEPDMDYAKQIGEMGLMDLYSEQCDLEIAITALEKQMQFPTLGELHRAKQMVDCEMNARDGELIVRRCDGTDRPQGSK